MGQPFISIAIQGSAEAAGWPIECGKCTIGLHNLMTRLLKSHWFLIIVGAKCAHLPSVCNVDFSKCADLLCICQVLHERRQAVGSRSLESCVGVWVCLQSGDLSNRIAVLELQSKDLSNRIAVLELQSEDLSNRIAVLELQSEDLSNRIAVLEL